MVRGDVRERSFHEGLITALAVGGFFIVLGFVFAFTPGIADKTNAFFSDLTTVSHRLSDSNTISLLAPGHPADHQGFYTAVMNFLIGVGVLQIVILVLRLAVHSRLGRIAETVGNLIFWLGAAVAAGVFLLAETLNGWYQFWSSLVIILGVSLVVRGIINFSRGRRVSSQPVVRQ